VRAGNFLEKNDIGSDQSDCITQLMQDELAVEKREPLVDVHGHDFDGKSGRIAGVRRVDFESL
jgi:hypothetical protein